MEQETFADAELITQAINSPADPDAKIIEFIKKHRFSALVDGICMGIGFVFLILGLAMPMLMVQQLIPGLLLIIGAILCLAAGAILEVYQWAKLD
ncbi:MAG: hypothetical protein ACUVT5_02120 [Candidatus Bathyarchaeales archaeon]